METEAMGKVKIPLEALDWAVDAKGRRLVGNPGHGGEWGMDVF